MTKCLSLYCNNIIVQYLLKFCMYGHVISGQSLIKLYLDYFGGGCDYIYLSQQEFPYYLLSSWCKVVTNS